MKRFFLLVFIAAALACSLGWAALSFKDELAKRILEKAVLGLTGFETRVGKLSVNVAYPLASVELENLQIYNPKLFRERVFTDAPDIYISLDIERFMRKERILIHEMRLHLREMHIEKNKEGISNVSLLKSVAKGKQGEPEELSRAVPAVSSRKKRLPFYLHRLELTLGKVSYEDRSGILPKKISVDLNVEKQVFAGIRDPKTIVSLVLAKILYGTTFGNLLDLNPRQLERTLRKTFALGGGLVVDAAGAVGGKARVIVKKTAAGVAGTAEEVVFETLDQTTGVLTKATGTAKQEITSLFGKLKSKLASQEVPRQEPSSER